MASHPPSHASDRSDASSLEQNEFERSTPSTPDALRAAGPGIVHSETERDRIARIRAGDEAAFEALFHEYYDPLCRYAAQFLGNRDQAEDIVQGVFARVWRDRERWAASNIRHYLYAAVRRRTMSEFRHNAAVSGVNVGLARYYI